MTYRELYNVIDDCCNDITFSYNGQKCGIEPEVKDYQKTFHTWYGNNYKDYMSADDALTDPFFSGKSIKDIYDTLDIWIS